MQQPMSFFSHQETFTRTFRDVVLGRKTIGRAQLQRGSPTFTQVYFLFDFREVYPEFRLPIFLFLRKELVLCRL